MRARVGPEHRATALAICVPMVRHVMNQSPPPGPQWAQQTLDSVAQAIADERAARTQAEQNLDTLWALLITDYSGELENKPPPEGWTADRELMLLRAARAMREARKGEPLEVLLPKIANLYRP